MKETSERAREMCRRTFGAMAAHPVQIRRVGTRRAGHAPPSAAKRRVRRASEHRVVAECQWMVQVGAP